jgi:hypothetical protein
MTSFKSKSWLRFLGIALILILMMTELTACSCGEKGGKTTPPPATAAAPSGTSASAVKDLKLPVNLKEARGIGSLHMEIVYDPAVLSATNVEGGDLAANSMIEFNAKTPGRLKVGVVDASGINGDGTLLTVSFKAIDTKKTSQISLENLECYNSKTLFDIVVSTAPGKLSAVDGSFTAPEVKAVK